MKRTFGLCALILLTASQSWAAPVTFAQYVQNGGGNDFVWTDNTTSATISGTTPIFLFYSNIVDLPAELSGLQSGTLTITGTTTAAGSIQGLNAVQPLDQLISISLIRSAPASVGNGSRTNLLTVSMTGTVSGTDGGNGATASGSSTGNTVTFSSDFVDFSSTIQRDTALGFSSVNPSFALLGDFVDSFTAAGTGTFSSDPVPVVVPEPSSVLLCGLGTLLLVGLRRSLRSKASPVLAA